jgi:hypothetical protein
MRRLLSVILLFCLGVLIPAQVASARFCLLDNRVLSSAFGLCKNEVEKTRCCDDCDSNGVKSDGSSCCLEMGSNLQTPARSQIDRVPPVVFLELSPLELLWMTPKVMVTEIPLFASPPVVLTGTPVTQRAMLGIWVI